MAFLLSITSCSGPWITLWSRQGLGKIGQTQDLDRPDGSSAIQDSDMEESMIECSCHMQVDGTSVYSSKKVPSPDGVCPHARALNSCLYSPSSRFPLHPEGFTSPSCVALLPFRNT